MKKSNNNTWKRIAAGALSLALVAGAMPANVGGLLTGGKGIVAHADGHTYDDLEDLLTEVNSWLRSNAEDLNEADPEAFEDLIYAYYDAGNVPQDAGEEAVNDAYDNLYNAYTAAKLEMKQKAATVIPSEINATDLAAGMFLPAGTTINYGDTTNRLLFINRTDYRNEDIVDGKYELEEDCVVRKVDIDSSSAKAHVYLVTNFYAFNEVEGVLTSTNQGIGDSATYIAMRATTAGTLGWTVDSEANFDIFGILVNGDSLVTASGSKQSGSIDISAGDIILAAYTKDGGTNEGTDTATLTPDFEWEEAELTSAQQEVNFYTETDDSIRDGCRINLYAEDEQSFETIITVKSDAAFTKAKALAYLGLDDEGLEVVQYDEENAFTVATISVDGADAAADEDEDGTYELPITFTVVPYNAAEQEEAPLYRAGSGAVQIGGMNINVAVAERAAAKTTGKIAADDLTYIKYVNKNGSTRTLDAEDLEDWEGNITIKADEPVTLTTVRKSWFNYNDGHDVEIPDLQETENADGTFTYTFTMPGYDVKHGFEEYWFSDNTRYDDDENQETPDVSRITEKTAFDNDWGNGDGRYYYGTEVTLTSNAKLVLTDEDGQPIEAAETKTTANDATTYTYTFKVTSNVNADLYEHQHNYSYKVEGNQLIRTCTLDDGFCDEDGELVVAELNNQCRAYDMGTGNLVENPDEISNYDWRWDSVVPSFVYDGSDKQAGTYVTLDDVKWEQSENTLYSRADVFGDPEVDWQGNTHINEYAPHDAGRYVAFHTIYVDVNGDNEYSDDEAFELTLPYAIKPYELTDDNVSLNGGNEFAYNGSIQRPDVNVSFYGNGLTQGAKYDYVVTGDTAASVPGEYELTVNGVGNFTGSVIKPWVINGDANELTEDDIHVDTIYANGYAQATVTVNGYGDYAFYVLGDTTVDAGGTYKLTVVGRAENGLYGSVEVEWVVDEFAISGRLADVKSVSYNADASKLTFRTNMGIPEGAVMTQYGLVATADATKKFDLTKCDLSQKNTFTDGIYIKANTKEISSGSKSASYTWNKGSVPNGDAWYAVPYVCFTIDGNSYTVYGDIVKATVSDGNAVFEDVELGHAKVKSTNYDEDNNKLTFNSSMIVPDGCTINQYGLLATNDQTKIATFSTIDLIANKNKQVDGVYVKGNTKDPGNSKTASYTWNKSNVSAGDKWYVLPYVIYTDEDGATYRVFAEFLTEEVAGGQLPT